MRIINKKKTKISKWLTLVTNSVRYGNKIEDYHSLITKDYVSIVALNKKKEIILVKQFRPAMNEYTIELPGGMVDSNLDPITTAQNELSEETGYVLTQPLKKIGRIDIDYGRISNNAYGFFANNVSLIKDLKTEKFIETVTVPIDKFIARITNNSYSHSPHISFVLLAKLKKLI
jgi:ADP-ribose pyrophosphatase